MLNIQEIRDRYLSFYPSDGIDKGIQDEICVILNLNLPSDFCRISEFFSGGLLGGISLFAITHENIEPNIVNETIRLRRDIKLPLNYIVLAEPAESLIIMDTTHSPAVIWCDAFDVNRIESKSYLSKPQTWNTYSDFISYLLDREEEERNEDN